MTAFFRKKPKPSPWNSGPQGLRRPRFSFFRFTCQTARKPCGFHFPDTPKSRRNSNLRLLLRRFGPHISEELRRRAITPRAVGAPYERGYMGQPRSLSTPKARFLRPPFCPRYQCLSHSLPVRLARLRAALEPHSSDVLAGNWEFKDVRRGAPLSVASDPGRSPLPVIDRSATGTASCQHSIRPGWDESSGILHTL